MFRFTIRDLFWLTVVVAMGAGWWISHAATVDHYAQLERAWYECFGQDPDKWLQEKHRPRPSTNNRP